MEYQVEVPELAHSGSPLLGIQCYKAVNRD